MNLIIKKLAKLIDLKSIVTLGLVIGLLIGFFQGKIAGDKFCEYVLLVLTFYFAKTDIKKEEEEEKPKVEKVERASNESEVG